MPSCGARHKESTAASVIKSQTNIQLLKFLTSLVFREKEIIKICIYKVTFHYIFYQQSFHCTAPLYVFFKEKKHICHLRVYQGTESGHKSALQKAGDFPF